MMTTRTLSYVFPSPISKEQLKWGGERTRAKKKKKPFPPMDGCFWGSVGAHISHSASSPLCLSLSNYGFFRASVLSLAQPPRLCVPCQSRRRSHPREFDVSSTLEASLARAAPNQTPPDALSVSIT